MDLSNNIPSLEHKTLEYLMNPQYDKLVKKHIDSTKINDEELDFIKKNFTSYKDMLSGDSYDNTIHSHFLDYVENLIGYFNFQDKYDLIQEEYKILLMIKILY